MQRVVLVLACLPCMCCGRQTQAPALRVRSENLAVTEDAFTSLKAMLLALQPARPVNPLRFGGGVVGDFVQNVREHRGQNIPIMHAASTQLEKDAWLTSTSAIALPIAPLLAPLRESASEQLHKLRFPHRREEPWRQFDLSKLQTAQIVSPTPKSLDMLKELLAENSDATSSGMRLVLVDGVYSAALSDLAALPLEVFVGSLADASGDALEGLLGKLQGALPETHADKQIALGSHFFAALNHASLSDVVGVWVPPGAVVDKTLHIVSLSTSIGDDSKRDNQDALPASHPNLVVSIGDGASLSMLQQYAGQGSYFVNGLSRLNLGKGASLKHYYVQEQSTIAFHIDSLIVDIDGEAAYRNQMLQVGGGNSRVNLQVNLNGEYASASLKGLTIANKRQILDAHTSTVHAAGNCTSSQEHRNAVGDRARAVFRGTIVVPEGSDKTVANQLARTLLLTDDARADVSPCLQIDTDDVECTHGATVADIDDEMVLYLRARGLSPADARALLLQGWADSALDDIPAPLTRKRVQQKALALSTLQNHRELRSADLSSI